MSQALIDLVREKLPDAVTGSFSHRGDEVLVVKAASLPAVIEFLRNDPAADMKNDDDADPQPQPDPAHAERPRRQECECDVISWRGVP